LENNEIHITSPDCKIARPQDCRTDLSDVTFLVPLRIDSPERTENINTLIKYTFLHFNTSFIVLEADSIRKYYPKKNPEGFHYEFIEDTDEVFHRTKWINLLISLADMHYVAVWDADAIAPSEQIADAVSKLRTGDAVLSFPYDGRFYSCDSVSCALFRKLNKIEILKDRVSEMNLMHGFHSVGGAFMVSKAGYIAAGGENENIYGWGPEDTERVKRLEIKGLPIYHSKGELFHLCHPMGKNSWFVNQTVERKNRKILQMTCKMFGLA
jgi:hypothetical protein